ncbi:MAG: hypothetical protein WCE20_10230 [Rhizomicrobium sp.]
MGVMSGASWKDIWTLIEKLVAEQPPFIQIAIGLGAAFSVLMFVEGLRANFFRRRPRLISTTQDTPPSSSTRSAALPTSATTSTWRSVRTSASFAPRALPRAVKCRADAVSRHRALRPKIRRPGSTVYRAEAAQPVDASTAGAIEAMANEIARHQSAESLPQVASFEG